MRTLDELDELGINVFVNGEYWHQEEETNYQSGTGLKESIISEVYGLTIDVAGKEYNIPVNALSSQLVTAIEELCSNELKKY